MRSYALVLKRIMAESGSAQVKNCIFCKITSGLDAKTELLYQDSDFAVFRDYRPAATHHYLIVPRLHIPNINSLKKDDLPLVDKLIEIGLKVLKEQQGPDDDVRLGFHCPPFITVSHLHLHCIAPTASMGIFGRLIFRPDSRWFITADTFKKQVANSQDS